MMAEQPDAMATERCCDAKQFVAITSGSERMVRERRKVFFGIGCGKERLYYLRSLGAVRKITATFPRCDSLISSDDAL